MSNDETPISLIEKRFEKAIIENKRETIIELGQEIVKHYQKNGKIEKCIYYLEQIIPQMMKPGMELELAYNFSSVGKYYSFSEEYDEAEENYRKALNIYKHKEIVVKVAEIKSDMGLLYRSKGIFDIALKYLNEAIEVFNKIQNKMDLVKDRGSWFSYINAIEACGIIYGQLKQYDESIAFFQDALKLKEKVLGDSGKISALLNLGVTYSNFDLEKSQEYYFQALREVNENTPINHKIVLLNNLGGCLEDQKQYDKALDYYQRALELTNETGRIRYKAPIIKHISSIYYHQGKYNEALKRIEESLKLSEKSNVKFEMKDCYQLMSDIYIAKNDYRTAMDYRLKYDEMKDDMYQQDLKAQLTTIQKKYEKTTKSINNLRQEKSLISDELKKVMNTGFVGESDSIKEVRRLAIEAASYKDTRVLVTGESGVGKEIVARLIHYSDSYKIGKFIDVNCCSIPESMAESEFFGFVKGAFTGAIYSRPGYFEEANNGSLFLDEIGDMPLGLQAKLLRVLETKQIKRLGSNKSLSVNFRLISATNKDLNKLIGENQFRGDLLYRINTIEINIPPLRERREDVEPLLQYFLKQFSSKMNKSMPAYSPSVLNCLYDYSFPGNVRELKNMIERTMIFTKGNRLTPEDFKIQMHTLEKSINKNNLNTCKNIHTLESQILLKALEDCQGNQTKAAKQMGISYSTFKRKYKKIREDYSL